MRFSVVCVVFLLIVSGRLTSGQSDNSDEYICVPYYECDPETDTIITNGTFDGAGVIDIRFGVNKCEHYMDVRCKKPKDYIESNTESMRTSTASNPIGDNSKIVVCGKRNVNGVDFKITGNQNNESEFGEFPWMVAIINKSNNSLAGCGGSIIHSRVVLTAAHCVQNLTPDSVEARAGEWDTKTTKERIPYQQRAIDKIEIHEKFNSRTLYNDIALLILKEPFRYDEHISPICLPNTNQAESDRKECVASGWGQKSFSEKNKFQEILKKIRMPLVSQKQCQDDLRRTRLGSQFVLHTSFICAGGIANQDTCTGDGGSPLVCPYDGLNNIYYQTGIVAWGIGCGNNVPGVYVNIAQFRNWIDRQMIQNSFDSQSYMYDQQ